MERQMGDEADADWDAGLIEAGIEDTKRALAKINTTRRVPAGNCEAPNGAGHTTADCPGVECRRTGQCQVA
jgi:hypothetical protein